MKKKEKEIIEKNQEGNPYFYMSWPEVDDMMNRFKYDLQRFFYPMKQAKAPVRNFLSNKESIPLDVADEGDHFAVNAEMPGIPKDKIEVDLDENRLTISIHGEEKKENKDKNYYLQERSMFSSKRSIELPEEVLGEKAKGNMEDGVLKLKIPKKDPKPKKTPHKVIIE